jgi:plastocyanin
LRRAAILLITLAAAVPVTGCGSSSTTSSSSSSTPAGTASRTSGSVQANTTPNYASPSPGAPVLSGSVQVAYRDISIHPDTLRVRVGSRVTWTNYDPVTHNVTSEGGPQRFSSGDLGEGGKFSIVASHAGVIHYMCTIHPASMNGTIEVVP